ncbi:hypothetical protein HFP72_01990 [Nocardiopsis sp. ARC36]
MTLGQGHTYAEQILTATGVDTLLSTIKNRPRPTTTIPGIDFDPHATPPLIGNWCRVATNRLQDLCKLGHVLTEDSARAAVEEVHNLAHHITPTPEDVERAIEDNNLVSIPLTSERMWPAGWRWHRHAITQPTAQPGEELPQPGSGPRHRDANREHPRYAHRRSSTGCRSRSTPEHPR